MGRWEPTEIHNGTCFYGKQVSVERKEQALKQNMINFEVFQIFPKTNRATHSVAGLGYMEIKQLRSGRETSVKRPFIEVLRQSSGRAAPHIERSLPGKVQNLLSSAENCLQKVQAVAALHGVWTRSVLV